VYEAEKNRWVEQGYIEDVEVFRGLQDPNDVHFVFEVNDLGKVQQLFGSPETLAVFEKAGVIGQPEMHVVDRA
jgi:hypothetical protein